MREEPSRIDKEQIYQESARVTKVGRGLLCWLFSRGFGDSSARWVEAQVLRQRRLTARNPLEGGIPAPNSPIHVEMGLVQTTALSPLRRRSLQR